MAVARISILLFKRFYIIYLFNLSFYLTYFLYWNFSFFPYGCFNYRYYHLFITIYESIDLLGKKGISLIYTF